ncbi:doublesex- and mab-3-related transcription factor C2 [Nematostella vectensis]|uniref:doublesex- and mab-3-related transcription factor C2 n=1 Tax=Nematostella vectensis TaxID=45351 RepID=UPI00138F9EAB|nr:doublesex- and mab-3-related transcription factor C2 [Nematostella vectensis]
MEHLPRRSRNPSCTLCSNHGIRSELKGHKYNCPYSSCKCELCDRGRERREIMRKQVKLRRHQMRDILSGRETAAPVEKSIQENLQDPKVCNQNGFQKEPVIPPIGMSHPIIGLPESPLLNTKVFYPRFAHPSSPTLRHNAPPVPMVSYSPNSKYYCHYSPYLSLRGLHAEPQHHSSPQGYQISKPVQIGGFNTSENSAFEKCAGVVFTNSSSMLATEAASALATLAQS